MKNILSTLLLFTPLLLMAQYKPMKQPYEFQERVKFDSTVSLTDSVKMSGLLGSGVVLTVDTVTGVVSRSTSASMTPTLQQVTSVGSVTTDSVTLDGAITPYLQSTTASGLEIQNNSGTAAAVFGQSGGLNSQFNGNLTMSSNFIKTLAAGVDATDAVNLQQLIDSAYSAGKAVIDSTLGWALYSDTNFTPLNKFVITAGDTVTLPNNGASTITSQLPLGVDSLFSPADTAFITTGVGNAYMIRLSFQTSNSNGNGYFTAIFDIGGASFVIPITARTFEYPKGAGVTHSYSTTNLVYSLGTYATNGLKVKIISGVGNTSIWNISGMVHQLYRGR